MANDKFLTYFPDHTYRYIDLTGTGRPPITSAERKDELNLDGYESYFTVNGFKDVPNAQKENCTSLNAFFVDIDGRKDLDELEKIKSRLCPTFITETQNGYHIYWVLDEPIYKDEIPPEEWEENVARWEKLEQRIVLELNADPVVKDIPRILRVPNTWYWKKTGDQYTKGTDGVFKIKGIFKQVAQVYSMDMVEEAFPPVELETPKLSELQKPIAEKAKEIAQAERDNFFKQLNEEFPIEDRDSFKRLASAHPESLHPNFGRNNTLHLTASLMIQAGWTLDKALKHIESTGWHGMESEPRGTQEIANTINSAYGKEMTYSFKHDIIVHNTSANETQLLKQAQAKVLKSRREQDKVRFSNYEREILARHPNLKKNEIGIVFRYHEGVYKMVSDQELSDMVLNGLYDDMLWGFRTKRNVSDKVACLISIIPLLEITDDKGYLANVKNGILNIWTGELMPHTPDFVSLVQYPVAYDPEATAPTWEACMDSWMTGLEQKEKTRLLQQFCGYILSSSMLYDRALFIVGDGGNGKSTFIDTIAMVIGGEATSHIDLESLYGQFGFKGLIGKRLNIIEEVHGNYYQSNKLKKLISGEQVTIDIKYKDQFTFRPQAKFVFSVNLLPRVDDTSTATERRICAVQFLNNYRDNPNVKLRSSVGLLAKELPGILNWMLEGAKDLHESGEFIVTDEQKQLLDEYRAENSSVEGFLTQCVIENPLEDITTSRLYKEYKTWSNSVGGRKTKANITFTKEVIAYGKKDKRFGFEPRSRNGEEEAKFVGISLAPQWINQRDDFDSSDSGLKNDYQGWK